MSRTGPPPKSLHGLFESHVKLPPIDEPLLPPLPLQVMQAPLLPPLPPLSPPGLFDPAVAQLTAAATPHSAKSQKVLRTRERTGRSGFMGTVVGWDRFVGNAVRLD
jgi:hypothetical protein